VIASEIEPKFSLIDDDYASIDPDFDDYDPATLLTRGEIDGYTSNWYGDRSLCAATYGVASSRHYAPFRAPIPESTKPKPKEQPQPEPVRARPLVGPPFAYQRQRFNEPPEPSSRTPGGVGLGGWFPIASAPLDGWPVWLGLWDEARGLTLFEGVWDRGNKEWRSMQWQYRGRPTIWRYGRPEDWGERAGLWGWMAAAERAVSGGEVSAPPDLEAMLTASASDLSGPIPPPSPSPPSMQP
jgi:hypothetical protein